jgi:hypothetical protein
VKEKSSSPLLLHCPRVPLCTDQAITQSRGSIAAISLDGRVLWRMAQSSPLRKGMALLLSVYTRFKDLRCMTIRYLLRNLRGKQGLQVLLGDDKCRPSLRMGRRLRLVPVRCSGISYDSRPCSDTRKYLNILTLPRINNLHP